MNNDIARRCFHTCTERKAQPKQESLFVVGSTDQCSCSRRQGLRWPGRCRLRSAAYWLSVISTKGFEKLLGRDGSFSEMVPGLPAPARKLSDCWVWCLSVAFLAVRSSITSTLTCGCATASFMRKRGYHI
jgi:hypothetical protein